MKTTVYNQKGEETGQVELPKEIFEAPANPDLISQVVSVSLSNRRQKIAAVKERDKVRGGGKKPWRQKGTGRARHGSIRSPIWRGGGVTFGPSKEKKFKKKIPKKMKRKALLGVLSAKAEDKEIIVLDKLRLEKPRTKLMKEVLDKLIPDKGSILIVTPGKNEVIYKAVRNIPKVGIIPAKNLNALDVLSFKYLLMPEETLKVIKDNFLK